MNFKEKQIVFGLDNAFYTFKNTILELKTLVLLGGNVIPVMLEESIKYKEAEEFVKEIEETVGKKVIVNEKEAEKLEMDIVIAAPFCR